MNGGGVIGALFFVIGALIAFALLFGFFLIVPFFVFLAGIVVMMVAGRRERKEVESRTETVVETQVSPGQSRVVEVEETTTVREVES